MFNSAINQPIAEVKILCTVSVFTDMPYDETDLKDKLKANGFIDPTIEVSIEDNTALLEISSEVNYEFDNLEISGYTMDGKPAFDYEEWDEADMRGDWD